MLVAYADDDMDDFEVVAHMFLEIDSSTRCINAANGRELLKLLDDLTVLPNLILLDINMPNMDGMSCLKMLRADKRFKDIPVYIYSNGTSPVDEARCRKLGATDYVRKHFSIPDMRRFLQSLVSQYA